MAIFAKAYSASGNTAAIHTGPVKFAGFTMRNDQANAATITVYNALTATGTIVWAQTVPATSSVIVQLPEALQIYASTGISVAITGTGPNAVGSVILE